MIITVYHKMLAQIISPQLGICLPLYEIFMTVERLDSLDVT